MVFKVAGVRIMVTMRSIRWFVIVKVRLFRIKSGYLVIKLFRICSSNYILRATILA